MVVLFKGCCASMMQEICVREMVYDGMIESCEKVYLSFFLTRRYLFHACLLFFTHRTAVTDQPYNPSRLRACPHDTSCLQALQSVAAPRSGRRQWANEKSIK